MKTYSKAKLVLAFATMIVMGNFAIMAQAQVLFDDPLIGTGALNGSSEPVSGTSWTADSDWTRTASFTDGAVQGDNAWLPFTPTTGDSYVLSETLTPTGSGYDTGLGFTSSSTLNSSNTGIPGSVASINIDTDNDITNGYDINVGGTYVAGNNNNYPSAGGTIPADSDPIQLTVDLTAAGSGWTASFEATDLTTSAVLFNSGPYMVTAPEGDAITDVGFHSEQNTSQVSDFILQAVPEPSTYALLAVGTLLLGGAQWRRRKSPVS